MSDPGSESGAVAAVRAWAQSGAMALTGPADGPGLGPPDALVPALDGAAETLSHHSRRLGRAVAVAPLELLSERAAALGLCRQGRTSCGGSTRLLPSRDGWLAVTLARPDDVDLVPAWLGLDGPPPDPWAAVSRAVEARSTELLEAIAAELGLAVGSLPSERPDREIDSPTGLPCHSTNLGDAKPVVDLSGVVVADLSGLWAGPLCGALLADAGAQVVKVESTSRPDGSRRGSRAFFDLLNANKRCVALDLTTSTGASQLRELVARAHVVIEASRPRALEQLGLDAHELVRSGGPQIWISITGHGRAGPAALRPGFGDDAAVSGGLVVWDGGEPYFCADAVADPATGLVAAACAVEKLSSGGRWLLDVTMSEVAAHLAGPTLVVPPGLAAAPPQVRRRRGVGPALGADNDLLLDLRGSRSR